VRNILKKIYPFHNTKCAAFRFARSIAQYMAQNHHITYEAMKPLTNHIQHVRTAADAHQAFASMNLIVGPGGKLTEVPPNTIHHLLTRKHINQSLTATEERGIRAARDLLAATKGNSQQARAVRRALELEISDRQERIRQINTPLKTHIPAKMKRTREAAIERGRREREMEKAALRRQGPVEARPLTDIHTAADIARQPPPRELPPEPTIAPEKISAPVVDPRPKNRGQQAKMLAAAAREEAKLKIHEAVAAKPQAPEDATVRSDPVQEWREKKRSIKTAVKPTKRAAALEEAGRRLAQKPALAIAGQDTRVPASVAVPTIAERLAPHSAVFYDEEENTTGSKTPSSTAQAHSMGEHGTLGGKHMLASRPCKRCDRVHAETQEYDSDEEAILCLIGSMTPIPETEPEGEDFVCNVDSAALASESEPRHAFAAALHRVRSAVNRSPSSPNHAELVLALLNCTKVDDLYALCDYFGMEFVHNRGEQEQVTYGLPRTRFAPWLTRRKNELVRACTRSRDWTRADALAIDIRSAQSLVELDAIFERHEAVLSYPEERGTVVYFRQRRTNPLPDSMTQENGANGTNRGTCFLLIFEPITAVYLIVATAANLIAVILTVVACVLAISILLPPAILSCFVVCKIVAQASWWSTAWCWRLAIGTWSEPDWRGKWQELRDRTTQAAGNLRGAADSACSQLMRTTTRARAIASRAADAIRAHSESAKLSLSKLKDHLQTPVQDTLAQPVRPRATGDEADGPPLEPVVRLPGPPDAPTTTSTQACPRRPTMYVPPHLRPVPTVFRDSNRLARTDSKTSENMDQARAQGEKGTLGGKHYLASSGPRPARRTCKKTQQKAEALVEQLKDEVAKIDSTPSDEDSNSSTDTESTAPSLQSEPVRYFWASGLGGPHMFIPAEVTALDEETYPIHHEGTAPPFDTPPGPWGTFSSLLLIWWLAVDQFAVIHFSMDPEWLLWWTILSLLWRWATGPPKGWRHWRESAVNTFKRRITPASTAYDVTYRRLLLNAKSSHPFDIFVANTIFSLLGADVDRPVGVDQAIWQGYRLWRFEAHPENESAMHSSRADHRPRQLRDAGRKLYPELEASFTVSHILVGCEGIHPEKTYSEGRLMWHMTTDQYVEDCYDVNRAIKFYQQRCATTTVTNTHPEHPLSSGPSGSTVQSTWYQIARSGDHICRHFQSARVHLNCSPASYGPLSASGTSMGTTTSASIRQMPRWECALDRSNPSRNPDLFASCQN
jgi:hypothetical protein